MVYLYAFGNLCETFCDEVALSMLCWLRGGVPTVEQPRGSMLVYHPAVQHWIHVLQISGTSLLEHSFDLGRFGAPTQKPIVLYSPQSLDLVVPLETFARCELHPPTAIVYLGSCHISSIKPKVCWFPYCLCGLIGF